MTGVQTCALPISVGDESVVCIIEAMKVMNEIHAEMSGEVVEILVEIGRASGRERV